MPTPTLLTVTTAGTRLRLSPVEYEAHPPHPDYSSGEEHGPLPLSESTLARIKDFMLKHRTRHLSDGKNLLSLMSGQLVFCGTMPQES